MATIDEIDTLDKSIKEASQNLTNTKAQLITLRRQLLDAFDSKGRAEDGARLMWDRLMVIKNSSIVDLKEYNDTRSLFYRNKDLASSKGAVAVTTQRNITDAEKKVVDLQSYLVVLSASRSKYCQLEELFQK